MKSIKLFRLTLIVLLSAWIASCATNKMSFSERTDAYNQYIVSEKLESIKKITAFRFDGWSSLGDEHLIISTQFNKSYLIKLRSRCPDLAHASGIVINNTGSTLQSNLDSISVPRSMGINCQIDEIYPITRDQKNAITKLDNVENNEEKNIDKNVEKNVEKNVDM